MKFLPYVPERPLPQRLCNVQWTGEKSGAACYTLNAKKYGSYQHRDLLCSFYRSTTQPSNVYLHVSQHLCPLLPLADGNSNAICMYYELRSYIPTRQRESSHGTRLGCLCGNLSNVMIWPLLPPDLNFLENVSCLDSGHIYARNKKVQQYRGVGNN